MRHYNASTLIASGADIKVVQARLRRPSASTTLNVYGHFMPEPTESARMAINAILAADASGLWVAQNRGQWSSRLTPQPAPAQRSRPGEKKRPEQAEPLVACSCG
jgi:hypothetical protein